MSKKQAFQLYLGRIATILSNWSVVFCVLAASILVSFMLYAFYLLILLIIPLVTLGVIFLYVPDYGSWFGIGNNFINFLDSLTPALPYLAVAGIVCALASFILFFFTHKKSVPHMVFSGIITVISVMLLIGGLVS